MLLKDFIAEEQNPLQNPKQDNSVAELSDTRKTRLTLEQINRLRQLNDIKIAEYSKQIKKIKKQYKAPAEESPGL